MESGSGMGFCCISLDGSTSTISLFTGNFLLLILITLPPVVADGLWLDDVLVLLILSAPSSALVVDVVVFSLMVCLSVGTLSLEFVDSVICVAVANSTVPSLLGWLNKS